MESQKGGRTVALILLFCALVFTTAVVGVYAISEVNFKWFSKQASEVESENQSLKKQLAEVSDAIDELSNQLKQTATANFGVLDEVSSRMTSLEKQHSGKVHVTLDGPVKLEPLQINLVYQRKEEKQVIPPQINGSGNKPTSKTPLLDKAGVTPKRARAQ